ncbi:MAG: hypothetical protein Q8M29_19790 [Bacteroidota bacterium]|nr:hypothetical protein [Bacteroidota bacterium]
MSKLPLYRAIEIREKPIQGGTTLPLLSVAENKKTYVLKLFGKKHANQRCYTGAEVYAHYLAKQFELNTPEAAFISIPKELIKLYKKTNPALHKLLLQKDYTRPCFATVYLGDLPIFSPALHKKYIESHDIETIYAFDTLILNDDRKRVKPNMLKTADGYCLIDHDKAFGSVDYALREIANNRLCPYNKYHLFYEMLKRRAKKSGIDQKFETFREYFNSLNLGNLDILNAQLTEFDYDISECKAWKAYLYDIKQNRTNFVSILKESLL